MDLSHNVALASGLISVISLIIAGLSWRTARRAAKQSELAERVKIFVDLRSGWHDIRKDLRRQQLDGSELPNPQSVNWDSHELYWQHAFTEWYITTKLHPELRQLWDEFFSIAIQKTLKTHRPLKYVAWVLVEQKRSVFGTYHNEFRSELERLNGGGLSENGFKLPENAA